MTSIYQTTDRLIGEHLDELLTAAWELDTRFVRLVCAARSLRERHRIDAHGRCRTCTRRRRLRRTRARPCTVHVALAYYLTQPAELVLRDETRV